MERAYREEKELVKYHNQETLLASTQEIKPKPIHKNHNLQMYNQTNLDVWGPIVGVPETIEYYPHRESTEENNKKNPWRSTIYRKSVNIE